MNRRAFITLLGGAAAAPSFLWPLAARAQQRAGKLPTIGLMGAGTPQGWSQWIAAFSQRLHELGWIEGRTVAIEYRWAEGRGDREAEIAAEFVRLKVDVIVTAGGAVARQATSVIPIVFAISADPVGSGLVGSLARPGGNITGLSLLAPTLPASGWKSCAKLYPASGGWRSWPIFAFTNPYWRWRGSRRRTRRWASMRQDRKSVKPMISRPPSRRSRVAFMPFMSPLTGSQTPTVSASTNWRLARGCRRCSVFGNISRAEA